MKVFILKSWQVLGSTNCTLMNFRHLWENFVFLMTSWTIPTNMFWNETTYLSASMEIVWLLCHVTYNQHMCILGYILGYTQHKTCAWEVINDVQFCTHWERSWKWIKCFQGNIICMINMFPRPSMSLGLQSKHCIIF